MIPAVGQQVPRRGSAFSRGLGRVFLRLLGWRVEGVIPDLPKMVWIGAPHTTNWDGVLSLATLMALGIDASTMIKDSAFKGPLGWLLRSLGGIPINRASPKGVVEQSIDQFASRQRFVLLIAPEGTRDGADDWKRGYYRIAEGAGVPVLPAASDYRKKIVTFGPAVMPSGDYAADLAKLLEFYRGHLAPRHPERLSKPFCELNGTTWNGTERKRSR